MDTMQDKQKSIGGEWAEIRIAHWLMMLRVGWPELHKICSKSQHKWLHHQPNHDQKIFCIIQIQLCLYVDATADYGVSTTRRVEIRRIDANKKVPPTDAH